MTVNVRRFLRDFAAFKVRARKGEVIRVQDRSGTEFMFTAVTQRRSLLGVVRGRITFSEDITRPTLADDDWKPSL